MTETKVVETRKTITFEDLIFVFMYDIKFPDGDVEWQNVLYFFDGSWRIGEKFIRCNKGHRNDHRTRHKSTHSCLEECLDFLYVKFEYSVIEELRHVVVYHSLPDDRNAMKYQNAWWERFNAINYLAEISFYWYTKIRKMQRDEILEHKELFYESEEEDDRVVE